MSETFTFRGIDRETGRPVEYPMSTGELLDFAADAAGWIQDEDGEWSYSAVWVGEDDRLR